MTVRTGKSSSRRKVVTHTATIDYQVRECYDESGQIESIYENTTYVFINYLKRFYFTDNKSEENFRRAFNAFVTANIRDVYQNHSHTFELVGYEEEVGFTAAGSNPHNGILFYVFTLLGMGLVYSFIIERMASRYEVGILKRLTA